MQTDFVEKDDDDFGHQLDTHGQGMNTHGATLDFSPDDIDEAKNDAKLWKYVLERQADTHSHGLELTAFKKLLRRGHNNQPLPADIPEAVANPTPVPTLTAADIEGRFRKRAQRAKAHPAYTSSIGQALGIVKTATDFVPEDGTPVLKVNLNAAGHPHLSYKKGNYQGAEIWKLAANPQPQPIPGPVQPDDPRFKLLQRVFAHDYVDPTELPSGGKAELWIYKAVYLYKNEPVGTPSQLVVVTVGGI